LLNVLEAAKAHETSTGIDRLPSLPDDATLQQLVAQLTQTPNGAVLVTDRNGVVIDAIDLFRVVRYLLYLYEESPMARGQTSRTATTTEERYSYWQGFDRWMESRASTAPQQVSTTTQTTTGQSRMEECKPVTEVVLEQPQATAVIQPGPAKVLVQQPAQEFVIKQPARQIVVEQPARKIEVDQPGRNFYVEQPGQQIESKQIPGQVLTSGQVCETALPAQKAGEKIIAPMPSANVSIQQDPSKVVAQVPAQRVLVEQPGKKIVTEMPGRQVVIEQPEREIHVQQPARTFVAEIPPEKAQVQTTATAPVHHHKGQLATTAGPAAAAAATSTMASTTTSTASTRASQSFFNLTIREMLAVPSLERSSRIMQPAMALPEATFLSDALHYWAEGYTNIIVKTSDGRFRLISQTDLLRALLAEEKELGGLTTLAFKKLGITRKVLYSVNRNDRALQAFRLMWDRGVHAVPITEDDGFLAGEISLATLRALRPGNFNLLFGSVGQLYDGLSIKEAPLIVEKGATLSNLLDSMLHDPGHRTHIWVASRKLGRDKDRERAALAGGVASKRVSSVVSMSDIVRAISLRLQSE
jgi:CBS domain-containing protein